MTDYFGYNTFGVGLFAGPLCYFNRNLVSAYGALGASLRNEYIPAYLFIVRYYKAIIFYRVKGADYFSHSSFGNFKHLALGPEAVARVFLDLNKHLVLVHRAVCGV